MDGDKGPVLTLCHHNFLETGGALLLDLESLLS